nr:hypothetical protein Iba_chr07aCG1970 [Ipomoea batatas]
MHSSPSNEDLPISGVTGYQTRSNSSYGFSIVSKLNDGEPFSHKSDDSLLPKITGILSKSHPKADDDEVVTIVNV